MGPVDLARKYFPEGNAKDTLREIYHLKSYFIPSFLRPHGQELKYDMKNDSFRLKFKKGILEGDSMILPRTSLRWIDPICLEIPSYFEAVTNTPPTLIIDAGSFPGDFATIAAKRFPGSHILALEPDDLNRAYLEKVVRYNELRNVKIFSLALSDNIGKAYFTSAGTGSKIIKENEEKDSEVSEINTTTIDCLVDDAAKEGIDTRNIFIKMDIEGYELQAYDGAADTISRGASFSIACYHKVDGEITANRLIQDFTKENYSARLVNPSHLTLIANPRT